MPLINAYAASNANASLKQIQIERKAPDPDDVVIEIHYCGICHSDVHQVRDEWGIGGLYPMVPGHEITGEVVQIGSNVTRYNIGDKVGVGCFIDSCRQCNSCISESEQYCDDGLILTYNGYDKTGKNPSYGGFSNQIVVDENYVLKIPNGLSLDHAAPLLCAGITIFSPLRYWNVKKGDRIAVIGMGGLGHIAIKLALAMGAEVTVFSRSNSKKTDAIRFGAKNFVSTVENQDLSEYTNYFDLILTTATAAVDIHQYLELLKQDATMVLIGIPKEPIAFHPFPLILKRRNIAGSFIGGIKETQEMLNFCAKNNVTPEIEVIKIDQVNKAFDRLENSDVKYRFVVDIKGSLLKNIS